MNPFPPDDPHLSEQAEQQANFHQFLLQQSLSQLQTLIIPPELSFTTPHQNALYASCQLVGQQLGLTFEWLSTPQSDTDLNVEERIHQLCLRSQIYYRKFRLVDEWWKKLDFPFVGFYEKDHQPVALISQFTKGYQLINPTAKQTLTVNRQLASQISPEGYLFYRALPEHKLTFRNLWTFGIWYRRREWIIFLFLAVCGLLVSISLPMITSFLFDYAIPNRNNQLILQIALGALLLILTTLIFNFNRETLLLRLMGLVDQDLELAIWQRMMSLPTQFFRKYSLYDLFTFTTAITSIRQLITSQVLMVFLNAFFSLVFFLLLFYYGQSLAFVALAILGIASLITLGFLPFIMRYGRQLIERQIQTSNKTFEIIQAISKIRLAAAEIRFFHRWQQTFAHMKRMDLKMLLLKMKMAVFNAFWSNAGLGILYLSVILVLSSKKTSFIFESQAISLGSFMAFMTTFGLLSSSLNQIIKTIMQVGLVAPLWERIKDFTKAETESFITKADPGILTGDILVDRINFSYQPEMAPVLQDLSFKIDPGKCVAFVGLSGCGKSTLVRLLLGFETPQQGSIYYDNKDMKGLNLQILRSQLGIGLQTGAILDGSIIDNITTGRHYGEAEVNEAMHLAGMTSFLQELPMKALTILTNGGAALSGGQRQMILLARALVGKPKIIILDEATSALDSQKQQEIHQNLSQLPVTRILITQRLDTLRSGIDRIYVLDKGKIVAQGTFTELTETSPLFSQLLIQQNTE